MKLKKLPFYLLILSTGAITYAQKPTDVLVTINDSIYNVADFERLYNKNFDLITDPDHKDVVKYFDLYTLYKLRLQLAYKEKYHLKDKITFDYNNFRKELAEKYFIDHKKLDFLVDEALIRAKEEVNASHLLIQVDEFASADDTLIAFNKIKAIKEEIEKGLPFEQAALKYSNDLSVTKNKGNLGYFSVFRMVYPFESGAYNTEVGKVSDPVRSNFGYHLIKVNSKRKTPDIKTISHILISTKDKTSNEAQVQIDAIYDKLQKGQSFDDLAFHHSEDIYTRDQYGALGVYNEGSMDIDGISDVVYGLNFKDAFSVPFQSKYGWHIIKVTSIKKLPKDEELKETFLKKVKSDQRSKVLEADLSQHLKEMYHYKFNASNLKLVTELFDRENMVLSPKIPDSDKVNAVVASFSDKVITVKDVLQHIYNFSNLYIGAKTDELLVKKAYDYISFKKLKTEYDTNLESYFPEFAHSLKEYKEGLLLFDIIENNIWKPAAEDSLGLEKFYNDNIKNYYQKEYFVGEVYVFENKSEANEFNRILNANLPYQDAKFDYKYKYQGTFEMNDKRLPSKMNLSKLGDEVLKENNLYYVFKVREKKENQLLSFGEVKNRVIADYQAKIEDEFNKRLLSNSKIEVKQEVLNQLKEKYKTKTLN